MTEREKFGSNLELIRYFENSLVKSIDTLKKIYENCKNSTQYQLNDEFRGHCESIKGLLFDMERDLEILRQRKGNLR